MSATDQCQVRRCRHAREHHVAGVLHYTRTDGQPGSFDTWGACTVLGCTCTGFTMMNGLQPTRPCRKCGEEFVPGGGHRLCPDCRHPRMREETMDALDYIQRKGPIGWMGLLPHEEP